MCSSCAPSLVYFVIIKYRKGKSPLFENYLFVSYKENAYNKNKLAHLIHHPLFTLK